MAARSKFVLLLLFGHHILNIDSTGAQSSYKSTMSSGQESSRVRLDNGTPPLANSSSLYHKYQTMSGVEQAYVNGGSLVSFGNKLQAQEKADMLDSLLYAELTANDKYDKTRDFGSWYRVYLDALRGTYWEIQILGFMPYDAPPGSQYTILKKVWDFLNPHCKGIQAQILKRLLDVWKLLEDYDHRVRCFLSSSGTGPDETNAANFQIMPAIRGNAGEVYVVFGGFYYESHVAVQRYLTHSWQATNISLHHTVAVSRFRSSQYATVRKTIQNTLRNRASQLIHEIDL